MSTADRREQLLEAGVELLRQRPHEQVSLEQIAVAAKVSKGLLYHYFPTKTDFIVAALKRGQDQLALRLRPDPGLPPEEQLDAALEAFLDYVEGHATAYAAIFRRATGDPAVAAALDEGRSAQARTLIAALAGWEDSPVSADPSPEVEVAIQGWLYFVEGAVLRWLEQRDIERERLCVLLKVALVGSLFAARSAGAPGAPALFPGVSS